jgi:pimeloyl-ACP methyl ester carboxylesterase
MDQIPVCDKLLASRPLQAPPSRLSLAGGAVSALQWPTSGHRTGNLDLAAPDIIFLHGLGDTAGVWSAVVENLRRSRIDLSVLALDLPGHGQSEWLAADNYTIPKLSQIVYEAIHCFFVSGRPLLIGHSLGARVALELATSSHLSPAALILVDMGIDDDPTVDDAITAYVTALGAGAETRQELEHLLCSRLPLHDRRAVEIMIELSASEIGGRVCFPLDPNILDIVSETRLGVLDQLREVARTVTFIRGGFSSVVQRATIERLQTATSNLMPVHTIAMSGHAIPLEQPQALAEIVAKLMTGSSLRSPGSRDG